MDTERKKPAQTLESALNETLTTPMDWEMIDTFAKLQELEEAARIIEDPVAETPRSDDPGALSDRFKPNKSD